MDKGSAADPDPSPVTDEEARKPAWLSQSDGVTDEDPGKAGNAVPGAGEEGFYSYIKGVHRSGHITHDELLNCLTLHGLLLRGGES
jgi:hypothetical protein